MKLEPLPFNLLAPLPQPRLTNGQRSFMLIMQIPERIKELDLDTNRAIKNVCVL
jgi:hypothetical protein